MIERHLDIGQDENPSVFVLHTEQKDRSAVESGLAAACLVCNDSKQPPLIVVWGTDDPFNMKCAGEPPAYQRQSPLAVALSQAHKIPVISLRGANLASVDLDESRLLATVEALRTDARVGRIVLVICQEWGEPMLREMQSAKRLMVSSDQQSTEFARELMSGYEIDVYSTPKPTGPVARSLLRAGVAKKILVKLQSDDGQITVGAVGALISALILVFALVFAVGVLSNKQNAQRGVDLAAIAAAEKLRQGWGSGLQNQAKIDQAKRDASTAATQLASANGLQSVKVNFAGVSSGSSGQSPLKVQVIGVANLKAGYKAKVAATAQLEPAVVQGTFAEGVDEYRGPLAYRNGKPMRPDVAIAFDRMAAAARSAGVQVVVVSGYRSNAEQAELFKQRPDPKWVAPPGQSLHRLGTELDIGPQAAYRWLAGNATKFGFVQRYSWEPWHYGYTRAPASSYMAEVKAKDGGADNKDTKAAAKSGSLQSWVPNQYRSTILNASIRNGVSAALLAAQLKQESGFNPRAVSSAGAQGIAQFMPGTARAVGLRDPFDPVQAINAQAKLMKQLLSQFGSVQLALAAYNAGPGNVKPCMCVPAFTETQRYVANIIALMRGFDQMGAMSDMFAIRLIALHIAEAVKMPINA